MSKGSLPPKRLDLGGAVFIRLLLANAPALPRADVAQR